MKRLALALSVGCAASALAGAALADPPGKVGRVAWIEDEVSFLPPGEQSWTWASVNYPVTDGESFWTGDAGRTEIQVGPIEVSADSETELDVLALDYGRTRLGLPQGSLDLKLWRTPRGGVTISTPAGDVVIDQPGEYRIDVGAPQDDGGYTPVEVTVFDGHAGAPGQVGLTDIGPGAAAVIYPGYDPEMQYAQDASIDDWARTREASEDWDVQAAYSPDVTGYGELAAYGDFVQDPNYGSVWYPAGVPYDWAPYRYGRWAYVAPWGYTWVDDQPWGFAPFHYGRWLSLKGHWAWTPGQWGAARPVYAPALVGWFGGAALTVDGSPAVGWVALAPGEPVFPGYAVSATYWNALTDASVAPASRRAIAIAGRARLVPSGAVSYANRAAPGALSVVGLAGLLPHVPVSTMPGPRGAELRKPAFMALVDKATVQAPPPAPVGHTALSPAAAAVSVPLAPAKADAVPAVTAKPVARVAGAEFAQPVPPVAVAPLAPARPVAPSLATAPFKPIVAPTPPAAIASR